MQFERLFFSWSLYLHREHARSPDMAYQACNVLKLSIQNEFPFITLLTYFTSFYMSILSVLLYSHYQCLLFYLFSLSVSHSSVSHLSMTFSTGVRLWFSDGMLCSCGSGESVNFVIKFCMLLIHCNLFKGKIRCLTIHTPTMV